MKFRTVIWDWNGTLLDDAWLCLEVMNGTLTARDLPPLSEARYQAVFDFPVRDYYRRVGFDFEQESFESLGAEWMKEYERRRPECTLHEEAVTVLDECHRRGATQTVLSAYEHQSLLEVIGQFDIGHFFDLIMGLDHIYADGKLENGRRLVEALKVDPEHCVLIGDTVHDYEVAQDLGIHCRLVPRGNHSREKLEKCGVPVYGSLHDLFLET